jgi:DNA-binding MarR family transcriptional regulator
MGADWLTAEEQRAWRAYLSLHRELTARLNRQLQSDSQLSLPDYEVLVHLSEAPGGRMRPYELAKALQWEQSRLSHQLSRMQRRGLVQREECTGDGRGAFMTLTPCGRETIQEAAPAHAAKVRELFFDALTASQVAAIAEISHQGLSGLTPVEPVCDGTGEDD